jgi:hypothetical protein
MNIPAELLRSTPRPARLSAIGRLTVAVLFALALAGLVGASFLYAKAGRDEARALRRASASTTTTGTVVATDLRKGKDKRRWNVTYSFDASGRVLHGQLRSRQALEVGSPVRVGYVPSDPDDNWIVGQEPTGGQFWLSPLVGLVSLALSGLIAVIIRREFALLSYGRSAIATVTGSKKVHHQHGHVHRVSFEFPLLNGSTRKGSLDLRRSLEPGTELVILYDPDQPKRVARYPLTLAKL